VFKLVSRSFTHPSNLLVAMKEPTAKVF